MTTIVSAARPAELLGLLPALAGFTPRRSLVLVPFAGGRSRGVMRVDLPAATLDRGEFVARVIGLVCQVRGADALAIVVYDDVVPDAGELPWSDLAASLRDRADACDLAIIDALYVGPDSWASFVTDPEVRHPISGIPASPDIPGVGSTAGDQWQGGVLPEVDAGERERVAAALEELRGALDDRLAGRPERRTNPQVLEALGPLDDLPVFLERVLESPATPDPFTAASLAWCLNVPLLRDVALVQWARNEKQGRLTLGAQLAFVDRNEPVPDALGNVLLGGGRRPDSDRLAVALTLVRSVAARVTGDDQVGPLVAAGWLAWALGRSTHADGYIRQALALDPEHSMASLIHTMLEGGLLPGWAFAGAT